MTLRGLPSAGTWLASLSLLLVAGCGGGGGVSPDISGDRLNGTFLLASIRGGGQSTTCPGSINVDGTIEECSANVTVTFNTSRRFRATDGDSVDEGTYYYDQKSNLLILTPTGEAAQRGTLVQAEGGNVLRITSQGSNLTQIFTRQN